MRIEGKYDDIQKLVPNLQFIKREGIEHTQDTRLCSKGQRQTIDLVMRDGGRNRTLTYKQLLQQIRKMIGRKIRDIGELTVSEAHMVIEWMKERQ